MTAQRGYATEDKNLLVRCTLKGAVMGSTLSAPATSFTAKIHIEDPDGTGDAVTAVEIVSDGGAVAASRTAGAAVVDWSVTLGSSTSRYYYVRVSTASNLTGGPGVTPWTASVWTGRWLTDARRVGPAWPAPPCVSLASFSRPALPPRPPRDPGPWRASLQPQRPATLVGARRCACFDPP